ncbi:MAG: glutamate--tRNA ligase [Pseudomonadales bacterium]|nr:glutamate--tRNA ligase [Pseudomonadales bacterium]MDP6471760.1 glutamate--tRNA ligase [Pseudomonadales bacterium]
MTVRTRVAPSPTGDPHVGTAYMALFNWVFAKSQGGSFILRIEDTDAARSTRESEDMIIDSLRWLGIEYDEGPYLGGPHGPYRQSERLKIYAQYAGQLLDDGHAFHCFCTQQRLDEVRAARRAEGLNPGYDGHCIGLDADEVARRIDTGEASVVRMRVPEQGSCTFRDELRGEIEIPYSQIDMQVLMKADGYPTYHLAVVVDDHLMGITHVLRGEEWISSVPKHKLLYDYFGWPMPVLVHLPLLRNPDSSKLSKRKNPTSVNYYRAMGFLPEALTNYLGMMGWSMPDEREIFSLEDMVKAFELKRISLGGPIFDMEKLSWLNGQYLRGLDDEAFIDRVADWAMNRDNLARLLPLVKERTERFSELLPQVDYLLGERPALSAEQFEIQGLDVDKVREILFFTSSDFDRVRHWQRDELLRICQINADRLDLKLRDFLKPLFVAVSGRDVSLPLFDSMAFVGSDITRIRIREALSAVGLSKKLAKRLEKAYQRYS